MGYAAEKMTILAFGDSLTAGYGLAGEDAFPGRLEKALSEKGYRVRVVNAGVSGDTSAGGAARIGWSLADQPDLVILELGANDALRGLDPEQTRTNLATIITQSRAAGARVLLAGMKAPRSLGEDYVRRFDAVYPELAAEFNLPLYPFFLDGVTGNPALNQEDGIHPNAAGVRVIVERILPYVEQILAQLEGAVADFSGAAARQRGGRLPRTAGSEVYLLQEGK